MTCKARRMNDQMHCHRCGFQWDIDDDDPPVCKTDKEVSAERVKRYQDNKRKVRK